jgi:hypothetical protein
VSLLREELEVVPLELEPVVNETACRELRNVFNY